MKVIIAESQYSRVINMYITYLLEPHEIMISEEYPESVFWVRDNEFLVRIKNSEIFYLDYKCWDRISLMFDLNHEDTRSAIKTWLVQHDNLRELTPKYEMIDLLF